MNYEDFTRDGYGLSNYPLNSTRPVKDVLINGKSVVNNFDIAILNCDKPIKSIDKYEDYFYGLEYDEIDYDYAINSSKNKFIPSEFGACTGFRDGNFVGRNFDWHYDNLGQFFIRVAANNGRYASMGIVSNIPNFTKEIIESGKNGDAYKIAPFHTVDGINEYGLVVTENVVPRGDRGITTKTTPTEEVKIELPFNFIPRYILDHYKTAEEAVNGVKANVAICSLGDASLSEYELHYLVSDKNNSFILEVVENTVVFRKVGVGESYPAIMTNFYADSVNAYNNGTIDASPTNESNITLQGCGLERHNVAASHIGLITSKDNMKEVMLNELKYTNAYREETTPAWYTELTSKKFNLTVETPRERFEPYMKIARDYFEKAWGKNRDGSIWYSAHTSIYDIENKKLYVHIGENEKEYEFDFKNKIKIK